MSKKAGVGTIKGVGEKTEKLFEKIGVYTVDDLIHYYPRGYEILENRFRSVKWRKEKSARSAVVFWACAGSPGKEDRSRLHI